jgi:hypothetical protein
MGHYELAVADGLKYSRRPRTDSQRSQRSQLLGSNSKQPQKAHIADIVV